MPTYEYRCPEGHDFEKFTQKMSNAQSELPCPTCGKVAARRLSAGGGLVFKGSGFYITDYGKDGKKDQRAAAKADAGKSDAGKSEGGKSDAGTTSPTTPAASGAPAAASTAPAAPAAPASPKPGPDK